MGSTRTLKKSIIPFAGSTLFNIAIEKVLESNIISNKNVYVSVYEQELLDIAKEYDVNIYERNDELISSMNTETNSFPKELLL